MKKPFDVWAKQRLIELRLDQKELAEELDVHPSQVNKMINGSRKITLQEFPKIAFFLKVSLEELFEAMGIEIKKNRK